MLVTATEAERLPLDDLRQFPELVVALKEAIPKAGYEGMLIAESPFVPPNGPGLVSYPNMYLHAGDHLYAANIPVTRQITQGMTQLVVLGTRTRRELRLSFSSGYVTGSTAAMNERGNSAKTLVWHNSDQLTMFDGEFDENPSQSETDSHLNIWVVYTLARNRMLTAWAVLPNDVDSDSKRVTCSDVLLLGRFDLSQHPRATVVPQTGSLPESIPAQFDISEIEG